MSQMKIPLQGNDDNKSNDINLKKPQNKTEANLLFDSMESHQQWAATNDSMQSPIQSAINASGFSLPNNNILLQPDNTDERHTAAYSVDDMADGNRRKNKQNASNDFEFLRWPEPKTLVFRDNNIGLYSPFVSTRRTSLLAKSAKNTTIYDGVPAYLNPNLMRQRINRSKSQTNIDNDNKNKNKNNSKNINISPQAIRSKSTKAYPKKRENVINDNNNNNNNNFSQSNLSKQLSINGKKGFFVERQDVFKSERGSFSYQELDGTDPNRDRLRTEWSLIDQQKQQQMTLSFVKTAPKKRLLEDFNTIWKRAYFALIILAIFNGMLTFCISKAASQAWLLESFIYEYSAFQIAYGVPAYLLLLLLKLILVLGAICLTRSFAPGCAGSGVPELRAILSGIWIRYYLSKTTFLIKTVALTLSLSSGVPIGLEGPFIHLSAIMGRQLTKLKVFAHLDRKQMLSAACAGGLASVFGAPIGGVLFSIEVTSTYYPVTNYWTAFCCAMVGSTMTHIFQSLSPTSLLLYQTSFSDAVKPLPREFGYFALLGLLTGLCGTFFIYFHDFYVDLRRKYQSQFFGANPYGIAAFVVIFFTTILFFIGDFAIEPARKAVSDMFNIEYLSNCDDKVFEHENVQCYDCDCVAEYLAANPTLCDVNDDAIICQQNDWCHCYYHDWIINSGLYGNLVSFYILNFFFTICTVTLSFPCGIFSPVFTLGSVFGRIFGELFRGWFAYCDPRLYSVVGAAALAGAVTQTISPAVIALEITQDLSLAIPCLLAVIVSGGVSTSLTHSFYDSVLQLRGIPMLPIRPTVAYKRVFIKAKKTRSPLSDILSIKKKDRNKSVTESGVDYSIDVGRIGVDNKPEIFDPETGRSKNNNRMLVNTLNNNALFENKTEAMYRLLIADDVMYKEFSFVTIDPQPKDLIRVLTKDFDQEWFPIVHTISEAVLVGEVRRSVLMDLLKAIDPTLYKDDVPQQLKLNHISFYSQTNTQLTDKASLTNDTLLLTDTVAINESVKQKVTTKSAETFRNKIAKWRSKDKGVKESVELDDLDVDIDSPSSDSHKIKITLMSSGFIERINLSPIQVISEMPLTKIYTLFHILKPQNVYVTKYSRLIGVINEVQLLKREFETQKTSKKARMYCLRCKKICRDCKQIVCCCC